MRVYKTSCYKLLLFALCVCRRARARISLMNKLSDTKFMGAFSVLRPRPISFSNVFVYVRLLSYFIAGSFYQFARLFLFNKVSNKIRRQSKAWTEGMLALAYRKFSIIIRSKFHFYLNTKPPTGSYE